jgi:hypothetical protein
MPIRPTILPAKAPADVVEYTVTFLGLAPDTIASATASATGLTIGAQPTSFTADTVTFWASGGSLNDNPVATVTITTTQGRTIQRSAQIPIEAL